MFKFITHRSFLLNLIVAVALALLLVFAFLEMLSRITKHGEHLTVPAVTGTRTDSAISLLKSEGFDVVIQDSVYTDTLVAGTVIKQLPDPGATVKVNRTVFITVNCVIPPMVSMPHLQGLTLDFALEVLQRNHLQLGDTIYKPDFMRNSVLEQQYNGHRIAAGTKIQWGSAVTLIVGGGLPESNIPVPDLLGMTYAEAKDILDSLGVMPVVVPDPDVSDTANAFIYKQNPEHFDNQNKPAFISPGMLMDIWLSTTKKEITDSASSTTPK